MHHLVLVGDVWGRELDFRPFDDEDDESLSLNSGAGDISNVMSHGLESPFGDSPHDIVVANIVSQRVQSDDDDLMISEVVQELPDRHQHGV